MLSLKTSKRPSWTVVSWIKTPPREFRPFVSVRVEEVQETVASERFRYMKSKCNPGDALTREYALKHRNKLTRGRKTPEMFMPHPSQKEGRATPSFSITNFRTGTQSPAYVHRFAERTRHRDVATGSLTVQELMQAELQLLKWGEKHINASTGSSSPVWMKRGYSESMAASKMPESSRKT